jgi:hypothetical protein
VDTTSSARSIPPTWPRSTEPACNSHPTTGCAGFAGTPTVWWRCCETNTPASPRSASSIESSSSTAQSPTTTSTSTSKRHSINHGETDLDALIQIKPQQLTTNPHGRYQLFRIGDATASRNIHSAIYDARRIALTI